MQQIIERLPTALSLRQIALDLGLPQRAVLIIAEPMLLLMKLQGTHPICECGELRFHEHGCRGHFESGLSVPFDWQATRPEMLAKREDIVSRLIAGERFVDIDSALGLPVKTARCYLRHLSEDQLERRRGIAAARAAAQARSRALRAAQRRQAAEARRREAERGPSRPFSDNLYAQIAAVAPRWLSDALRDDVISDVYAAVLAGDVQLADLAAATKKAASRARTDFESDYGPRSLDETRFEDGSSTYLDELVDYGAMEAFEDLDDMRAGHAPWRKAA